MLEAGSNKTRHSLAVILMALVAAAILSSPSTSVVIAFQPDGQQNNPLALDENLKRLETAINGNVFEVGKRNAASKYEIYKYEGFRSDSCSIRWRETHEIYDEGRRILLEVQDVTAPLPIISPDSVETNKISSSGYLVSFTTQKLRLGISARVHSIHEDGSENETGSIASGYGFYFSDGLVAKKVAKALGSAIRSCSKSNGVWLR